MTTDPHTAARVSNPVIAVTMFYANRWAIREYANGMYDAAAVDGPVVSIGFASFDQAVGWVCDRERDFWGEDGTE